MAAAHFSYLKQQLPRMRRVDTKGVGYYKGLTIKYLVHYRTVDAERQQGIPWSANDFAVSGIDVKHAVDDHRTAMIERAALGG